ncbi:Alpha/beta hydrolase domain-containing protein 17C [Durusdinium trenchii]|uniref:Alpha/beta hydrolase domain-containing protein 17C n=1 Tax=Durusdinium trenchii TaxID=1381693 RepID=A0ABP0JHM7_9DINO
MCYGSAKPIFMSDAPGFLQRQRARAAKHLVSEHAGTITCRCQKCILAAEARTGPTISSEWPLPPVKSAEDSAGFLTVGQVRAVPSRTLREQKGTSGRLEESLVQWDFTWLLRVMSELSPSEGGGLAGTLSYDGVWTPDPRSLQGKLGILVPETVILEKGKPKRRYFLDAAGRIGVVRMKTSAELLRVLRDFVRRAAAQHNERQERRSSMRRSSRSEPSLARALSPAADAKSTETPSALRQIEVAALHYNDGLSRQMMLAEAVSQIKGASKLPREFWQRMRMLQVPILSAYPNIPVRYIAYSFDINSGGLAPQEPMPLGGGARIELRTMGKHSQQAESEVARMAAVPKALNEFLKSKARRVRMEIVKGLFEFVLDEGDSTLWLANASKLRCRFLPKTAQDGVHDETLKSEVLFFEEEDFEEEMRETESVIEYLKKRFGGDPGVASGGNGVRGIEVSASDQLAGVGVPSNLVNFYEEEEKMLRYYEDEVRIMALRRERLPQHESKAVGLGCWFRRWVKAVKGVRPPQGFRALRA